MRGVPRKTSTVRLGLNLNVVVKAGGIELAQAFAHVFSAEGLAFHLREMTGEWGKPVCADALEGNMAHGLALKLSARLAVKLGRGFGRGTGC
jgi:hypothetical protein